MSYQPPKGVRPPQLEGKRTGRPKGSRNLAAAPQLAYLTELDLGQNAIEPEGDVFRRPQTCLERRHTIFDALVVDFSDGRCIRKKSRTNMHGHFSSLPDE